MTDNTKPKYFNRRNSLQQIGLIKSDKIVRSAKRSIKTNNAKQSVKISTKTIRKIEKYMREAKMNQERNDLSVIGRFL